MGEVKRYETLTDHGMRWCDNGAWILHSDYARLERERDVFLADKARLEHQHNEDTRQLSYQAAELTRLRAVEAEYAALQRFMRDRMPALIAARLAADDGYDPEDQHGGLYDLRWSGGVQPEPMGDAWSMDYLPRGEKIAADLAEACGRKG